MSVQESGNVGSNVFERDAGDALRTRDRNIFEGAGVSIWETDFTAVVATLVRLRRSGVTDFARHFAEHPEVVHETIALVKVLDVNAASIRMFGAADKQELMSSLERIVVPETVWVIRDELLALADGRDRFEADVVLQTLSGERLDVLMTVAFPAPDAAFPRALVTLVDITRRKRAEKELRASEERYRAVVESQTDMICRFRLDGTILFVNDAYARQRGVTPDEIADGNFWDFIPEADHAGVRALLAELTPARPEVRIENRFSTIHGDRWTLWTNRALSFDDAGRLLEAQSTGIDITDRKRAEEALLEADRQKDEFIATLSHELRNPLAPLRNALSVLRMTRRPDPVAAKMHEVMDRQVSHLVRLVDDLLEISRISRGVLELRRERVDLEAVVSHAIETSEPLIRDADHELEVALPAGPVWLDGDPVRLAQILANLLNNAARYTPTGGRIRLRAETRDGLVVVSVEDNGVGFSAAVSARLFEMFGRGEGSSGLGIGLSLARRLAEMHGGTLEGASAGVGQGAVFTMRLPIASAEAAQPNAPARPSASGVRKRILVVDDNVDAAETLRAVLDALGAEVDVAHDGHQALAAFAAREPALVLLDIGMPEMDGYEVARAMRSHFPERRPVIVALTGWGQQEHQRRSREAGFDCHLVKPADLTDLRALVDSLDEDPPSARPAA